MVGRLRRTKSMQPKAFEEDVQNSAGASVIFVKATQCNFHLEPEVAATFEQNITGAMCTSDFSSAT